jgi:TPR repeat protein
MAKQTQDTTLAELKAQLAELDATITMGVANGMPDSYPVNYAVLLQSYDRLAEQVKQAEQRAETATVKELRARLAGLNGAIQASEDPAYTTLLARAWLKTAADLRHETETEAGTINRRLANITAY